jgi:hypothetical protein
MTCYAANVDAYGSEYYFSCHHIRVAEPESHPVPRVRDMKNFILILDSALKNWKKFIKFKESKNWYR